MSEPGLVRPVPRKHTWFLLALGALVLAAFVWSALGGPGIGAGPTLEPPVIPKPNGYDDVLEAARIAEKSGISSPKVDIAKADEATLAPLMQANREAILQARVGLALPFQVPVVYDMNQMMNVLMKDLGSIRAGLVRGLVAEGRLAGLQGRVDDAARSYVDLVHLGDAMSHKVPMLPFQVSVAIQTAGLRGLRDLRAKLSPDQCRRLIKVLEEFDSNRERSGDVTQRESEFMTSNINKMGFMARISMRMSGMQARGLAQVKSGLESSEKRQNAARRVLLTDLALRVYRQEHGANPPEFGALAPSILKSVPLDPYSEKPLLYFKHGKDGEVYSVGPDRDDDKLTQKWVPRHGETANGDFTIDSF